MGGCRDLGDGPARNNANNSKLLELYSVGRLLGEGSSCQVHACHRRSDGEELAVKMVDKIGTPVKLVEREAEILRGLQHPNIVAVHGLFQERCFVCIVMDLYPGGDLVDGLQRHLQGSRLVDPIYVARLARQMGASIEYLHSKGLVHRDIKGDNYLLDREDIADPGCRIALADFGVSRRCGPEERLQEAVGTCMFWAPEVFDQDYGPKVDVWAMGVVVFGLLTSRFPFQNKEHIRGREVFIPKWLPPQCQDFLRQLLCKSEEARPTSAAAFSHPWISEEELANGARELELLSRSSEESVEATKGQAPLPQAIDQSGACRRLSAVGKGAAGEGGAAQA